MYLCSLGMQSLFELCGYLRYITCILMSKKLSIWSSKVSFLNVEVYDMTLAFGHIKLKLSEYTF